MADKVDTYRGDGLTCGAEEAACPSAADVVVPEVALVPAVSFLNLLPIISGKDPAGWTRSEPISYVSAARVRVRRQTSLPGARKPEPSCDCAPNKRSCNHNSNNDDRLQLMGDHLCGYKPSAIGQLTRPTQPFILPRSIN